MFYHNSQWSLVKSQATTARGGGMRVWHLEGATLPALSIWTVMGTLTLLLEIGINPIEYTLMKEAVCPLPGLH